MAQISGQSWSFASEMRCVMSATLVSGFVPVVVTCVRTKMIGTGTSYDVYVSTDQKGYHPISGGCYATTVYDDGGKYYHLHSVFRTPAVDGLPALTDERSEAFQRLQRHSERIGYLAARRAYPELRFVDRLPTLWANWDQPSDRREVTVHLPSWVVE